MKQKMWAYLLHLGDNMWGDPAIDVENTKNFPELLTDDVVWRQVVDFLPAQGFNTVLVDVGDGMQYESHPEISVKGAWSKDKLRKELDYMRSIGLTPIPKLNFSAAHDSWLGEYSRMLSTSIYYKVVRDVIMEVAEVFDYPKFFHLGMDEEEAKIQSGLTYITVRQRELLWHDFKFMFDVCEEVGARPWIWADLCWDEKYRDDFMKRMPKSVLMSNWSYGPVKKNADGSYRSVGYEAYRMLEAAGFEQMPCCSTIEGWDKSPYETMQLGKEEIAPERLVGYLTAPWCNPRKNMQYRLLNDAQHFGVAKKEYYPEECK